MLFKFLCEPIKFLNEPPKLFNSKLINFSPRIITKHLWVSEISKE